MHIPQPFWVGRLVWEWKGEEWMVLCQGQVQTLLNLHEQRVDMPAAHTSGAANIGAHCPRKEDCKCPVPAARMSQAAPVRIPAHCSHGLIANRPWPGSAFLYLIVVIAIACRLYLYFTKI